MYKTKLKFTGLTTEIRTKLYLWKSNVAILCRNCTLGEGRPKNRAH